MDWNLNIYWSVFWLIFGWYGVYDVKNFCFDVKDLIIEGV